MFMSCAQICTVLLISCSGGLAVDRAKDAGSPPYGLADRAASHGAADRETYRTGERPVEAGPCPGTGDCCSANGTPGCSDFDCCDLICFIDSFCCDTDWDQQCADSAVGSCAASACSGGCPGTGDCCISNGTPGCDVASCCDAVCGEDPFCCNANWDSTCAGQAATLCSNLCAPPTPCDNATGNCCVANPTGGCSELACCTLVCDLMPSCCDGVWGPECVALAEVNCVCEPPVITDCPAGATGDCCDLTGNDTPGCVDECCCRAVCTFDSFCCEVSWDSTCADEASGASAGAVLCPGVCTTPAPTCPGAGSCFVTHASPGCSFETCCNSVCEVAPECCTQGWGPDCAAIATDVCLCPETVTDACCDPIAGVCENGISQLDCASVAGVWSGGQSCLDVICEPSMPGTCGGVNESFEAGTFNGWIAQDISGPFSPLQIGGGGMSTGFGFFTSAPTDGTLAVLHGFDGSGPGTISVGHDVALPMGIGLLEFDYRGAWNLTDFGATLARVFQVVIRPAGGGLPLQTPSILLTADAGTTQVDTGSLIGSVDVSAFAGQTVRLSFEWLIPERYSGPGFFQLDNIRCSPGTCPDTPITWVQPPDGFIDARQPHPLGNSTLPLGISQITVDAAVAVNDPACWVLCETNQNPALHVGLLPNAIVSGVINGGLVTLGLLHPLTPGEVTKIAYVSTSGATVEVGTFIAHPADVDGDGTAAPSDILAVIDALNLVTPLPDSQTDADRSGIAGPEDILRAIDLLNGAASFDSWFDVTVVDDLVCP